MNCYCILRHNRHTPDEKAVPKVRQFINYINLMSFIWFSAFEHSAVKCIYLFTMHNKDARYTLKVPLYIKFQTARYHNFAQFGISYTAVANCICRKQCFPICHATGKCDNRTTWWIKQIKLSEHPKLINKGNSRSEIWHYFWYKTGDKGEWTDRTAPVCKHCYRPKSCCHRRQHIKSF